MQALPRESTARTRDGAAGSLSPANLALLVASVLVSILLVEIVVRLATGSPLFALTDWRMDRVVFKRIGDRAMLDPTLGWTLKPWLKSDDFTTMSYGIRRNFGETEIRTGSILAVGDSFTEGWDVGDNESWPAYLERLIHFPVVNGGVFGYGTDQIVLRAEQLLPIVKPKLLIVGFLEFDIFRAAHSDFGGPKPYFTFDAGKLKFHSPTPVEPKAGGGLLATMGYAARNILGYSAAANYLMQRLAPNYWHAGSTILYHKNDVDAAAITCALLDRLKGRVEATGTKMLLFMQHNEYLVRGGDRSSEDARRVVACAKDAGIPVVDQFASLRAIAVADPNKLRDYYFAEKDWFGHMTPKGNQQAAGLLAAALAKDQLLASHR